MNEVLQKGAVDALETGVKVASGATVSTGMLTALEALPQVLGCMASVVGICVTLLLYLKKSRIMDLQIKELESHKDDSGS